VSVVSSTLRGRRFVVGLYLALVVFSGVAGVLFARVVDDPQPPSLFFVFPLPATEAGFALYGALTVALVLGTPLSILVLFGDRIDDAAVDPSNER
jgi:hypothetical protein